MNYKRAVKKFCTFSTDFSISWQGKRYEASIPGAGKHLALAGLAACLVLVVGLYSAARFRH